MVDAAKLDNAMPVLPAEVLDLRFAPVCSSDRYPAPRLEENVIFEHQFNPQGTVQTLGSGDSGDRNDEALLQYFERKPLFQFHSCGAEDGPD
jgi:hypothetical protein